jgi:hypothetical protein
MRIKSPCKQQQTLRLTPTIAISFPLAFLPKFFRPARMSETAESTAAPTPLTTDEFDEFMAADSQALLDFNDSMNKHFVFTIHSSDFTSRKNIEHSLFV